MPGEAELSLRDRLSKLRSTSLLRGVRVSGEVEKLEQQLDRIAREETDEEIWLSVELARHDERPFTLDYVGRLLDDPVELPLQALELARELRAAQERQAPQAAQLGAQPQLLGLTGHRRRGAAAGPASAGARVAGRWRRRGHSRSWTRPGRSHRAASRESSAARRAGR